MKKRIARRVALGAAITVAALLILHSVATVVIYEAIFSSRFETPDWMPSLTDYVGLECERSDFETEDGLRLAGYKYSRKGSDTRGVVVVSHGFGNGHRPYLPLIDRFTAAGYLVFTYDATGTDGSDGNGTEGLVQAVVDLEHAVDHARSLPEYRDLPFVLFGHSMGAYAAGSVLELLPEIRAAVLIAPFNESEDMLRHESAKYVGALADVLLPSIAYYEWLKFGGKYADISVADAIKDSSAGVLIVGAADDGTVPPSCGLDILASELSGLTRVEFLRLNDGGHTDLMYSPSAREYREELNRAWEKQDGGDYDAFMMKNVNKSVYFEIDAELLSQMLGTYNKYCLVSETGD